MHETVQHVTHVTVWSIALELSTVGEQERTRREETSP